MKNLASCIIDRGYILYGEFPIMYTRQEIYFAWRISHHVSLIRDIFYMENFPLCIIDRNWVFYSLFMDRLQSYINNCFRSKIYQPTVIISS